MSGITFAMSACDREPIHFSGAIQPHGCLLGVNLSDCTVEFASENVSNFLNKNLSEILGVTQIAIETALQAAPTGQISRFSTESHIVYEFEGEAAQETGGAERLLSEIQSATVPGANDELARRIADAVQRLTGFHRIMIYKFAPDWSGTVIAETIAGNVPSFMDLRFPASDIPVQVRRLFTENLLRYIPDVNAVPVPILSCPDAALLDLSQSKLRSVSPIHIEYLKNMEVGASMSLSILVDDKLWGLIACHHSEPLTVSLSRREHCKILSQLFSQILSMNEQALREKRRADAKITQIALLDELSRATDFLDALTGHEKLLLELVHATSACLKVGDRFVQFGDAPTRKQSVAVMSALDFAEKELVATDNFASYCQAKSSLNAELHAKQGGNQFSGALAAKLSSTEDVWLIWFRPEVVTEVSWAGEPTKSENESEPEKLHPRRSFAIWKETVSGFSHPWTEEELSAAEALAQHLRLKIERDRAEQTRQRLTIAVNDSNQKLAQFVDTIAHDLRSPLISIGNLAQWVEKDLGDSITGVPKDNLILLQKRVAKMRAQLNELLDFSKAGKYRAKPVLVNVSDSVLSIVEGLKSLYDFDYVIDELPEFFTVKAPLEHVFSNLLENASRYSERPRSRIEVGCEDIGAFYRFHVADQGKGIPVEYLEEIFLPLRSLNSADSESHGMGLAFVKQIVEQAGGEVSVISAPNEGSRFSFTWKKVWDVKN